MSLYIYVYVGTTERQKIVRETCRQRLALAIQNGQ